MQEYNITLFRGRWHIVWWEDGEPDAAGRPSRRRIRNSLATKDIGVAKAEAAILWAKLKQPAAVTVAYLWQAYRDDNAEKRLAANMVWSGKAVLAFFGEMEPLAITTAECRRYVAKRTKAGRQPGTVWTELNHLQIVLNWAKRERRIDREISIERPPKPAPRDRRLTREEARRLLRSAKAPHVTLAIAILLQTAARIGAVLQLTWDRVDLDRGMIALADPGDPLRRKGRATVPMTPDLQTRLQEARRGAQTDFVVEWAGKRVLSIKRGFAKAVEEAGLANVTPHVLRHTAASWMAEDGHSMAEIAAVLGHSDSRTTERVYAKFSPSHLRRATASLDMSGVPTGSHEPV